MARIVQLLDGVTTAQFEIDKPEFLIGRAPKSDIYIDDASVSTDHCIIETVTPDDAPAEYYIRDLGSTNGTYVNGKKITKCLLKDGDTISVARSKIKYVHERGSGYGTHGEEAPLSSVNVQ